MRHDITGMRWNRLTAVRYMYTDEYRRACWLFRCDCGKEKILQAVDVKRGNTKSCGCLAREKTSQRGKIDITGKRFGRLTAVRPTSERNASASVVWECQCDCGETVRYSAAALNQGKIRSCGCLYRQSRTRCATYRRDIQDGTQLGSLVASKNLRPDNRSGCTGVSWDQSLKQWRAYINFQKKRYYLGTFEEFEQAVTARKQAEQRLHDPLLLECMELLTQESKGKFLHYLSETNGYGQREYRLRTINGMYLLFPVAENPEGPVYVISMNETGFSLWQNHRRPVPNGELA